LFVTFFYRLWPDDFKFINSKRFWEYLQIENRIASVKNFIAADGKLMTKQFPGCFVPLRMRIQIND